MTRLIFFTFFFNGLLLFLDAQERQFALPKPSGKYAVGTKILYWVDSLRPEQLTEDENDYRRLSVQIWYPATTTNSSIKAPYDPLTSELNVIKTNSYLNCKSISGNFPVILLCPGRGTEKHFYTCISEDLASNGYVVVAIDMPFIGRVKFPDGSFIKASNNFKLPQELFSGPYSKVDSFFEPATLLGLQDVKLVVNQLAKMAVLDPAGIFSNTYDLNNIGIFGHSLGGRIAGAAADSINGIKAYISMEGIIPRNLRLQGINPPIAFMMGPEGKEKGLANFSSAIPSRKNDLYIICINGFGHNSVTDLPLIDSSGDSYKIDPVEGLTITCKILCSYFNRYLKSSGKFTNYLRSNSKIIFDKYEKPKS